MIPFLFLAPPKAPVKPPVKATAPVTVPFRLAETAIIVDATVNGRPGSFMFDTGFGGTVVIDDSIDIGKATGTMGLRDFVRVSEAPTVKLRSLKLGDKVISPKDKEAVQIPQDGISFSYGQHVDGIMGLSVIKDEITEINFQQSKFVFHPPSVDISKRVPDNKRTFLAKLLPLGANSLEMAVEFANGKKAILALDTGNSFYATTHRDTLERVGLWKPGTKPRYMGSASVASGEVDTFEILVPEAKIYGIPVKNAVWDVIDLPASSADGDGTVGFGFLKNFNIIIDYGRRRVWLENFTGKVKDEDTGEIGISAGYDSRAKAVRIFDVSPDTPAALAGIKEDDLLLDLDGRELGRIGYRKIRAMLTGPVGSKVKLAISRNGTLIRYELERKALVNELEPIRP